MSTPTKGIGRLVQFGIAKEATRGTSPAAPTYYVPWSDGLLEEKFENVVDTESYGIVEDSANISRALNYAEGTIKVPVTDQSFGLWLLSLLGVDTPALHSGETTVYDHVFTVLEGSLTPTLSAFIHDPIAAQDYAHANGVVKKLSIDAALKKYAEASIDLLTMKGVQITSLTPSQSQENRFVPQMITFKQASNIAGLSSATPIQIKSLKIDAERNYAQDDNAVFGLDHPADFVGKEVKITGSIEAIMRGESDFKTIALANTPQAVLIDLKNTSVTLGTAANPELQIELAKVFYTDYSLPRKVKDLVYQTVKFEAVYSITDALMAKITNTNVVASY